jgi:hypothetical protein
VTQNVCKSTWKLFPVMKIEFVSITIEKLLINNLLSMILLFHAVLITFKDSFFNKGKLFLAYFLTIELSFHWSHLEFQDCIFFAAVNYFSFIPFAGACWKTSLWCFYSEMMKINFQKSRTLLFCFIRTIFKK